MVQSKTISAFLGVLLFFSFTSSQAQSNPALRAKLHQLTNQVVEQTEASICNPNFLKSKAWKQFVKALKKAQKRVNTEAEFTQLFNAKAQSLPFSHFHLKAPKKNNNKSSSNSNPVSYSVLNDSTAFIQVRSFSGSYSEMLAIVQQFKASPKAHLIIDLRNNAGGTLEPAVPLVQFLADQPINAGVFISRNWFNTHQDYPNSAELKQFKPLAPLTVTAFRQSLKSDIGCSLVLPSNNQPTFTGKLFVLANQQTASACEPFLFLVKHYKLGTIVGEKSAGEMLSATYVDVGSGYQLFIPEADYMTITGTRLDKRGVTPDVAIASDQALDHVLSVLIK
ncbi:MAG: S41 family peptidase [Flammeovirgaceae bacterium]